MKSKVYYFSVLVISAHLIVKFYDFGSCSCFTLISFIKFAYVFKLILLHIIYVLISFGVASFYYANSENLDTIRLVRFLSISC